MTVYKDWRIRQHPYCESGATLYTVYRFDPDYRGCCHDYYRAISSKPTLTKAFEFIADALKEPS